MEAGERKPIEFISLVRDRVNGHYAAVIVYGGQRGKFEIQTPHMICWQGGKEYTVVDRTTFQPPTKGEFVFSVRSVNSLSRALARGVERAIRAHEGVLVLD